MCPAVRLVSQGPDAFADAACLACLYWPTGPRRNRNEIVAEALDQHPARVLAYMVVPGLRVGQPLPPVQPPLNVAPELLVRWSEVPIARDIGEALFADPNALALRAEARVEDLYHNLCAGTLLPTVAGNRHREVVVPLAHQSALAGIMLATELLVAERPDLARHRPLEAQARFDFFSPAPPRPVPLGRPAGCICADGAYRTAYESRWPSERAEEVPQVVGGTALEVPTVGPGLPAAR